MSVQSKCKDSVAVPELWRPAHIDRTMNSLKGLPAKVKSFVAERPRPHIGEAPTVSLHGGAVAEGLAVPFPLNAGCHSFFTARYALYHGLSALGLKPGDRVFAPGYCCGTEIDPLLAKGLIITWYSVDRTLRINAAELARKWTRDIKALLVVHYLGFDVLCPELVEFCREKQIFILEDCAHAFLSSSPNGEPLGSRGELSVFSLKKSLPVPDGGLLYLSGHEPAEAWNGAVAPSRWLLFFRVCELLAASSTKSERLLHRTGAAGARLTGRFLGKGTHILGALRNRFGLFQTCTKLLDSYVFEQEALKWAMSSFTRRALGAQKWDEIVKKRRENFNYLLEGVRSIGGIHPLFESLTPGMCPLLFPIIMPQRKLLHDYMLSRGIDTAMWWSHFHPAVPWREVPEAVALKRDLLGIPVHQDLTLDHMSMVIDALRRWNKSK